MSRKNSNTKPRNQTAFYSLLLAAHKKRTALFAACFVSAAAFGASASPGPQGKVPKSAPASKDSVNAPRGKLEILRAMRVELWRGKYQFRNIGVNIPDLFGRFLRSDDAGAQRILNDAQSAGVRFVRCPLVASAEDISRFKADHAAWLAAFERMLTASEKAGISIVPSLLYDMRAVPDYLRQSAGKTESAGDYLTSGTASNQLALAYVQSVVASFKDDARVLFWEIGNEYNLAADLPTVGVEGVAPTSDQVRAFLIQMASAIKKIDKKHLVESGNGDMRLNSWHLREAVRARQNDTGAANTVLADTFDQYTQILDFFNPDPLDMVSIHQSVPGEDRVAWLTEDDEHAFRLPWSRLAAERIPYTPQAEHPAGKPLFVGDFGQKVWENGRLQNTPWLLDYLQRIGAGYAPLAAVSAWEYRESGANASPYSISADRAPDLVKAIAALNQTMLTDSLQAPFVR